MSKNVRPSLSPLLILICYGLAPVLFQLLRNPPSETTASWRRGLVREERGLGEAEKGSGSFFSLVVGFPGRQPPPIPFSLSLCRPTPAVEVADFGRQHTTLRRRRAGVGGLKVFSRKSQRSVSLRKHRRRLPTPGMTKSIEPCRTTVRPTFKRSSIST